MTAGITIAAFRIGKWGSSIGTFVKIALVVLFTVLFIPFLVQHGRPARASTAADLKPSVTGFLTAIGILVFLCRKYPGAERPYRVPGGQAGAWLAVIITEAFVVVIVVTLLWPGAINALFGQPYSITSSWGVSRVPFESVTLGSLAVMIAVGLAFWALGERKRRAGLPGITVLVPGSPAGQPSPQ